MQRPQHYRAQLHNSQYLNERKTFLYVQFKCTPLNNESTQYPGHLPRQYGTFILSENTRRSYSFASEYVSDGMVDFVIEVIENGAGSQRIAMMSEGDSIELLMPYGRFYFQEDTSIQHHVFVGTGSGIVPLKPMLEHGLRTNSQARFILLWGMRYNEDLFWENEFQQLSEQYSNLQIITTITKPDAAWNGNTGRVTTYLNEIISDTDNTCIYLCGGHAMIHDARAMHQKRGLIKSVS